LPRIGRDFGHDHAIPMATERQGIGHALANERQSSCRVSATPPATGWPQFGNFMAMNNAPAIHDLRSALDSVVNSFEPRRIRFRHLEPFKDQIRDLRNRGAAFVTIAEILRTHSIKASREAVRQFYRHAIESKRGRRKTRDNKEPRANLPSGRVSLSKRKRERFVPATPTERGPRIARVEDL